MKEILNFMRNKITKEEFLELNSITNITTAVKDELVKTYEKEDADMVDLVLWVGAVLNAMDESQLDILHKLLLASWHYKHEEILAWLQDIGSLDSLEFIYKAISLNLPYFEDYEGNPFLKRCVRALYYIGKEHSAEYLKALCDHPDEDVREMAKHQLMKIK